MATEFVAANHSIQCPLYARSTNIDNKRGQTSFKLFLEIKAQNKSTQIIQCKMMLKSFFRLTIYFTEFLVLRAENQLIDVVYSSVYFVDYSYIF